MKSEYTPQITQACERWLADKVLIDLLKDRELAALRQLGDSMTDSAGMFRGQGVYKAISEFIKFIELGAKIRDKSDLGQGLSLTPFNR